MGAVSDAVVMENFDRLRQWALALAVAVLGFGCMTYAGLINPFNRSMPQRFVVAFSLARGFAFWLGHGLGFGLWLQVFGQIRRR